MFKIYVYFGEEDESIGPYYACSVCVFANYVRQGSG